MPVTLRPTEPDHLPKRKSKKRRRRAERRRRKRVPPRLRKMRLQGKQKPRRLLKRGKERGCRMKQFVSAPISSPNAGADLVYPATRSPTGSRRSDNCSPRLIAPELKGVIDKWTRSPSIHGAAVSSPPNPILSAILEKHYENALLSSETRKAVATKKNTSHACAPFPKKSNNYKQHFHGPSIRSWLTTFIATATTRRSNSWKVGTTDLNRPLSENSGVELAGGQRIARTALPGCRQQKQNDGNRVLARLIASLSRPGRCKVSP